MTEAAVELAWVRFRFVVNNPRATDEDKRKAHMRFERTFNRWVCQ